MSLPTELWTQILLEADLSNLMLLCSTNQDYYKICSSSSFWRTRFRNANLPIVTPQESFAYWLNEFQHTQRSMNDAARVMANFPEEGVFVQLERVNRADVFPDYAQPRILAAYLTRWRAVRFDPYVPSGLIALHYTPDTDRFTLGYEVDASVGLDGYDIEITREQAAYLLFLFFYYVMNLTTEQLDPL